MLSGRISYGAVLGLGRGRPFSGPRRAAKHLWAKMTRTCGNPRKLSHFLHSCTFVGLDEKGTESVIGCKIKHFHEVPGWRNWQTQRTQNPPVLSTLGVRLPLPAPANSGRSRNSPSLARAPFQHLPSELPTNHPESQHPRQFAAQAIMTPTNGARLWYQTRSL